MTRALIYVRLSSHRGEADPSTSPGRQREACAAYCAAKGWEVVEVIEDLDVSGSDKGLRLDRPGLKKVRAQWADVDVVVFAKLDRLARNVVDFRDFAQEAERHGAALVSVAESLDLTTPGGRFVATILAAFAEMEAAAIAERVSASMGALAELRRWRGGNAPYGYRSIPHPSGKGRALEVDPEQGTVVREAVERVLAGESLTAVVRDFNARGVAASKGTKWSVSRMHGTLTGDASRGYLTRKGEPVRDAHGMPEVVWPPLVSDTEAAQLRARFGGPKSPQKRRGHKYLLTGFVSCGGCHRPLVSWSPKPGVVAYRCRTRGDGAGWCDSPVSIRQPAADDAIARQFLDAVGDFPVTRIEVVGDSSSVELAAVEVELGAVAARMAEPDADAAQLFELLTRLRARREELKAAPAEPTTRAVATGHTFAEEWAGAPLERRRELLGSVLAAVEVKPVGKGAHLPAKERLVPVWHNA